MPELTEYERGARDMQNWAAGWLQKEAGEFERAARRPHDAGMRRENCAIAEVLEFAAIHVAMLPFAPPASPEKESKDV